MKPLRRLRELDRLPRRKSSEKIPWFLSYLPSFLKTQGTRCQSNFQWDEELLSGRVLYRPCVCVCKIGTNHWALQAQPRIWGYSSISYAIGDSKVRPRVRWGRNVFMSFTSKHNWLHWRHTKDSEISVAWVDPTREKIFSSISLGSVGRGVGSGW